MRMKEIGYIGNAFENSQKIVKALNEVEFNLQIVAKRITTKTRVFTRTTVRCYPSDEQKVRAWLEAMNVVLYED